VESEAKIKVETENKMKIAEQERVALEQKLQKQAKEKELVE
jgi:hypothetical protein